MKYVRKEDYDRDDFSNLIEAENTAELEEKIGHVKGYGVEPCMDERADGILYIRL